MPGKPISTPEDHGQSTEHFGEDEEAGVSETSAGESVAGAGDGEVGEGVDKVEEGAEGGEGSSVDGSQGGEDIQEEEDSQEESIPEGQGGTGPNGQENDLAEGSIPSGDNTEELGGPGEEGENEEGSNYLVAAGSAYPCPSPGYFSLTGSCREFWVCKEVGPGLLSAERPFRCPKRYLFDPITRLCQREAKVECQPSLFYSLASRLAIPLREDQLEAFFSSPLTLESPIIRPSISQYSPRLTIFPSPLPLLSPVHHRPPHAGMFYWLGK